MLDGDPGRAERHGCGIGTVYPSFQEVHYKNQALLFGGML